VQQLQHSLCATAATECIKLWSASGISTEGPLSQVSPPLVVERELVIVDGCLVYRVFCFLFVVADG
jgi:hypothetical protein